MKKILALILVLATVLTFASCGATAPSQEEIDNIRGEQIENTEEANEEASEEAEETVPAEEEKLSLGSVSGTAYESKFIGLGCKFPAGWNFYNEEQMKELNNLSNEVLGDDYLEALEDATVIQDMFATSADQLSNMTVALEKVSALQLATLDVAKNFEAVANTVVSTYEASGFSNVTYEIDSITIEGKEFATLNVKGEISGISIYQTSIGIKCSGYLATIAVTSNDTATLESLLDSFYLVK